MDQHFKDKQFVRPLDYETPGYSSFQKCMYPYAEFYLAEGQRLLSPGHIYNVAVELDLPENQNNENIGVINSITMSILLLLLLLLTERL